MVLRKRGLITVAAMMLLCVGLSMAQGPGNPGDGVEKGSVISQQGFSVPRSNHVVVIMEENRSAGAAELYMTYLKSLADQYSQALQTYSDSHGSWLAYGELTSGMAPFNGQGDHGLCTGDGCTETIAIDNLVRRLVASGKTWKGYFQSMPSIGYMGYQYGTYVRRHNPFPFYSDVANYPARQDNMEPADPYMLQDIVSNNLASFTWISPDLDHDAHSGGVDQLALIIADYYLRSFLPQLLASSPFQANGDGVLIVTFDESEPQGDNSCGGNPDHNNCGGHIWTVVVGPKVKQHYSSNIHYMQGSQFRLICDLLGISPCPGDGAASPSMSDLFKGLGTP